MRATNITRNNLVLQSLGFGASVVDGTSTTPFLVRFLYVCFNYLCDVFYLNPEAHAEAANTSVADPVKPRVSAKKKRSSRHVPAMLPVSAADDNTVPEPPTARGMRVRKRADVVRTDNDQAAALRRTPLEWLQWGKASLRYESKGWLVDELLHALQYHRGLRRGDLETRHKQLQARIGCY